MFDKAISQIRARGETIEINAESDKMVPSIELIDGKSTFCLELEGKKYPCLERAWASWSEKILAPKDRSELDEDERTGRRKRWSSGTIRKFLSMTPAPIADKTIKAWWEMHKPADWNVIKYADNGVPGKIRYIGTDRYRLYKNLDFLADLSKADFGDFEVRNEYVDEDNMIIRVTGKKPLKLERDSKNLFSGFHMLNSENGSSSIILQHLIYDLLCTNGLMVLFSKSNMVNQKHIRFDMDSFREAVQLQATRVPEAHDVAEKLVSGMVKKLLPAPEVGGAMSMYQKDFNASTKFIDEVIDLTPDTGTNLWRLTSSITEASQKYSWKSRVEHETQAYKMAVNVMENKHLKYVTEELNG